MLFIELSAGITEAFGSYPLGVIADETNSVPLSKAINAILRRRRYGIFALARFASPTAKHCDVCGDVVLTPDYLRFPRARNFRVIVSIGLSALSRGKDAV